MSCCSNQNSICPCGAFIHPAVISNVAGLDAISYRVGDYTSFREALLRALPGEVSLTAARPKSADGSPPSTSPGNVVQLWRPGATGDLAVQMMEWWAYLADILTFYNERTATQAYIRTADQPITVNRLVRLLGYRPKPGIGATGTLAALRNGTTAFTLPQGFQIQSKPGPGLPPQIFEVSAATTIQSPDVAAIDATDNCALFAPNTHNMSVLLSGVVKSIKANDQLFLLEQGWNAGDTKYAPVTVAGTTTEKDPFGNTNTVVTFQSAVTGLPSNAMASGYRLVKSTQSAPLWPYFDTSCELFATANGVTTGTLDLASVFRQIKVGGLLWITGQPSGSSRSPFRVLASVSHYAENLWYANATSIGTATTSPGTTTTPGVPVLHTTLGVTYAPLAQFQSPPLPTLTYTTVVVAFGFQDVGTLIGTPSATLTGAQLPLLPPSPPPATLPSGSQNVMIEDANGNGIQIQPIGTGTLRNDTSILLPNAIVSFNLAAPARFLFNLLPVNRGKTVANEVLGSGNASVAGQDFVLQNTPVTYLADSPGISGDGFTSTVQVFVNNLEWTEVQNFFGQPANAQVFITKEDEQGQTHVIFGDGVNGARPPTGVNNIVATYRYGSGSLAPAAGSLTVILKPLPGLQAIRNPVQVGGGGDPDPPSLIRQMAPRSVLTFGRAISLDDYQAIAVTASGVTCAQAVYGLNPSTQRPQVQIFVLPGTAAVVQSAQNKLAGTADPNRIPAVQKATLINVKISATLILAPNADPATVQANATNALAGQGSGLFVLDPNSGSPGVYILGIGQAVFDSQIYAALKVAGVQSVAGYAFSFQVVSPSGSWQTCGRQRHDPQSGNYFAVALSNLSIITSPPATAPSS